LHTGRISIARLLLLVLVCVLALAAGLGQPALWEPDEPRFIEATLNMLNRGDFLTPWFNGQPRFEKPILFYWLQLPFVALLGASELAARLPALLAAAGCVGLTWLIGRRLFGSTAAWMGALALATSFRFVAFARQGLTDVPALFFQLLALYGFLRLDAEGRDRAGWAMAWTAVGLAALTKGPVAVIPVAVWVAFYAVRREWTGLQRLRVAAGASLALAVTAPWLLYMITRHGRRYLDVALLSEVVARVRGDLGPSRGLLYYFDVWPADLLPWTPFFVAALAWLVLARHTLEPPLRRAVSLLLVWFVVVVALFSLAGAKLPHYLLPAHPAAALLTAVFIDRAARGHAPRALWWTAALLVVVMLLGGTVLVWAFVRRAADSTMAIPPAVLPGVLALGAVAIVALGRRRGALAGGAAVAVTTAAAAALAATVIVPSLTGLQAVPQLGAHIAARADPAARVGQYGSVVSAGLVYYARHRIELLTTTDAAARFLRAPGDAFLVLPRPDAEAVAALAPGRVHEIASSARLVVRLDRLFGDRSPFEDGLVVVTNRTTEMAGKAGTPWRAAAK
jgi:4-amino-4-deoxy-L-arabinose transferase-like glycosyltransferase